MAIAFDATTVKNQAQTSTLTWAHTITGSNPIVFVNVANVGDSTDISAATYSGTPMVSVAAEMTRASGGNKMWLFYLKAPPTGVGSVDVSISPINFLQGISVSYTGVDQTNPIDDGHNYRDGTASTHVQSVVSVADNDWVISAELNETSSIISLSSIISRGETSAGQVGVGDTNGVVSPAGAKSVAWKSAANTNWAGVAAAFKPVSTVTPTVNNFLTLLGVGT